MSTHPPIHRERERRRITRKEKLFSPKLNFSSAKVKLLNQNINNGTRVENVKKKYIREPYLHSNLAKVYFLCIKCTHKMVFRRKKKEKSKAQRQKKQASKKKLSFHKLVKTNLIYEQII